MVSTGAGVIPGLFNLTPNPMENVRHIKLAQSDHDYLVSLVEKELNANLATLYYLTHQQSLLPQHRISDNPEEELEGDIEVLKSSVQKLTGCLNQLNSYSESPL